MKRFLQSSLLAAASVVFASGAFAAVKLGKAAPDFTLTDTNGVSHQLSQYKGRTVVLEWVNLGCPFVQKHYNSKNMQTLQRTYTGRDVVWLSICSSAPGEQGNLEPAAWNKEIAQRGIASSAVLLDANGAVGRLYAAKTTPHMFVINPEGVLVYDGAIDNKPTTNLADVTTATNYVVAALDAVLADKPVATTESRPYGCSVKYASTGW